MENKKIDSQYNTVKGYLLSITFQNVLSEAKNFFIS